VSQSTISRLSWVSQADWNDKRSTLARTILILKSHFMTLTLVWVNTQLSSSDASDKLHIHSNAALSLTYSRMTTVVGDKLQVMSWLSNPFVFDHKKFQQTVMLGRFNSWSMTW
jgi:alpha-D-ribose 1-methylphosphonate 5-triphosphate synthase subunit PhnH